MFDLTKLYSYLAPIATPIPSSLFIAADVYTRMQHVSTPLAWIAGVGAFVGFEATGGCCTAGVVKLHNRKQYGWDFWLCVFGILAYIVMGVWMLNGAAPWTFLILTPFAVFGANTLWTVWQAESMAEKLAQAELEKTKAATRLANAQRRLLKTQQSSAKSEQNFACSSCDAEFSSIKALNGHRAHCKAAQSPVEETLK